MPKIDIIIPSFNSHKTIIKTLSSIAMQENNDDIKVTIVNDGGKSYKDIIKIFKPLLDIQELSYSDNKGPGYARDYGIGHTKGDYILFMDSDDTLVNSYSLSMLINEFENNKDIYIISTPFYEWKSNLELEEKKPNLVWVHGKMYRKDLIEKYDISFSSTRSNEDVGFNMKYTLAMNKEGSTTINELNFPIYNWHYNEKSITRRSNQLYDLTVNRPGYIFNMYDACVFGLSIGLSVKQMEHEILCGLIDAYIYYNLAIVQGNIKESIDNIEELSRRFFYKFYNDVTENLSRMTFNETYNGCIEYKQNELRGINFRMTFPEFVEFMFSKEPTDKPYEEMEKEILDKIKDIY